MISCLQPVCKVPSSLFPVSSVDVGSSSFFQHPPIGLCRVGKGLNFTKKPRPFIDGMRRGEGIVCSGLMLPVDPWAPNIDSQSIASQLFAFSLFPYIGFLYFITKSKSAPKLTLFGFYFLLAFVGATIPAGIYAKVHYGTSLSNVDWLHGGAESLLTLTNLFIVLGLRQALRNAGNAEKRASNDVPAIEEENNSSV